MLIVIRFSLKTPHDILVIGLEGIVVFFVIWYLGEESIEIFKQGPRAYFKQFWNFMDIVNLFIFAIVIILRVLSTFNIQTVLADVENVSSAILQRTAFYIYQEQSLNGVNGLLMWFKSEAGSGWVRM